MEAAIVNGRSAPPSSSSSTSGDAEVGDVDIGVRCVVCVGSSERAQSTVVGVAVGVFKKRCK